MPSRQFAPMPHQRPARPKPARRETSLYAPVKRFLETLGFDVKGEICGCDLVALRSGEPPLVVVGELKLGFNLELVLQGINRTAACDEILACGPHLGAGRPRARSARAQALPVSGFRTSGRIGDRPRRGAGRAGTLASSPRPPAPITPRQRTPAAPGRSGSRRIVQVADHDRLPPAGACLCGFALQRPPAHIRGQGRHPGRAQESFCATCTAGFFASSAASMGSPRRGRRRCHAGPLAAIGCRRERPTRWPSSGRRRPRWPRGDRAHPDWVES